MYIGIREFWSFGEDGALAALEDFVHNGCYNFEGRQRFRADRKYTGAVHVHHFGCVCVRVKYVMLEGDNITMKNAARAS